jgi:hypothetical protein
VRNCNNDGILVNSTGGVLLSILNTTASNNGVNGIEITGSNFTTGEILNSVTDDNGNNGISFSAGAMMIVGSTANNNGNDGFNASNGVTTVTARDCTASSNQNSGFHADRAGMFLAHSVTTLNRIGLLTSGNPSGVIHSFGDNHIAGNGTDESGTVDTSYRLE